MRQSLYWLRHRRDYAHPLPLHAQEDPWREARSDRYQAAAVKLAAIGIEPAVAALMNVVHYGVHVPPEDLCRRATSRDYSIGGPVTLDETHNACERCFATGWLQVVDETTLAHLQAEVGRRNLLGPIYGYPTVGSVEFTAAGAEQWFSICQQLRFATSETSSFAYCDMVHEQVSHWFLSESQAHEHVDAWKQWDDVTCFVGPRLVGPWRAQWWRRFNAGFRIDVERRMHWQGECNGGGLCHLDLDSLDFNIHQAMRVLRRHGISLQEWLTLASLESINARDEINRQVSRRLAQWDVNMLDLDGDLGIEACLRNQWLQRMDGRAIESVQRMLTTDAAMLAYPFRPEAWGYELDFTPQGAEFYRALSAEIHGPDWEQSLSVHWSSYRVEHRYCATKDAAISVQTVCAESGESPIAVRVVPIGAWCVYWWQRFESGYRVELVFGEPGAADETEADFSS